MNFKVDFSLSELPKREKNRGLALPNSLIPKPDTTVDPVSGLPERVLARALEGDSPLELALVVAGNYNVGVTTGELRTWELEGQSFKVKDPFYIGVKEVSHSQYSAFANANPNANAAVANDSNLPITNISARQAAEFCNWVGGRLPTDLEWEAAVRGRLDTGFPLPWSKGSNNRNLDTEKCRLFRGESEADNNLVPVDALPNGANQIGLLNTMVMRLNGATTNSTLSNLSSRAAAIKYRLVTMFALLGETARNGMARMILACD